MSLPPLWPWQAACVSEVPRLLAAGYKQIAVTLPTGMGKSRCMAELAHHWRGEGKSVLIYTDSRFLTGQHEEGIQDAGMVVDFIAAGFEDKPLTHKQKVSGLKVQIASAQTVLTRMASERIDLPKADVVMIDECDNGSFDALVAAYRDEGSVVVGWTATPVGLEGKYQTLVVGGTLAEGRQAGAIVRCDVIAGVEPDVKGVRWESLSDKKADALMKQCVVVADIIDTFLEHNAARVPTLLWAPAVPESRGIVQQFNARGVPSAHIDGETPDAERREIKLAHKAGEIVLVSSQGVLRRGVDWPWIEYGILVQPCLRYSTWRQTVGRLLRAYPGKRLATLQDHAGTWWRHGSPNEDRDWVLRDTDKEIAVTRRKRLERGEAFEGLACPRCHGLRRQGPKCPHCGYEHSRSVRYVRTEAGDLRKMTGPTVKRRREPTAKGVWIQCLYAAAGSGRTVGQARAIFRARFGDWLPADVRPQPANGAADWDRLVSEVYPNYCRKRKLA